MADFHSGETHPLRLGDVVPNFSARSTCGSIALSDYRGHWLIMFSHPGDFTPVCTSEFVAIARAQEKFDALQCRLIALSVDSLFSHFAWVRLINDRFGTKIGFPILEDPTMAIGRAYGMVSADAADASSVRSTYFIDPEGILRASTCYPANVGRSVEEMLRTLAALQRVHDTETLTPADWRPGDHLLRSPQQSLEQVYAGECVGDWFYQLIPDREGR